MRRDILKTIFLLSLPLAATIGTNCAPSITVKDSISLKSFYSNEYHEANRAVRNQTGLSLPEGWFFPPLYDDDDSTVFMRFSDADGFTKGLFQYFQTDIENISPYKLAMYSAKRDAEKGKYDISIQKTFVDENETYILTSRKKEDQKDFFDCYIVEGKYKRNYNFIRLYSEKNQLFNHPETAYRVFYSYKLEPKGYNLRVMPGLPKFTCSDGKCYWAYDLKNRGYIFRTNKKNAYLSSAIFLEKSSYENPIKHVINFYSLDPSKYDIPEYEGVVNIGGIEKKALITGMSNNEGWIDLSMIFNHKNGNYFLRVRVDRNDYSPKDAKETLANETIKDVLAKYISFE